MNIQPRHVAIIMDGNGRWAEARNKPRVLGHRAGAETVRTITEHCRKRGVPFLTLYAFSTENWTRPQAEVDALMELLAFHLETELPTFIDNDIRLRILGDPDRLSQTLRDTIEKAEKTTAENHSLTLSLAINYGGRDEIVRACRRMLANMRERGQNDANALNETLLANELDTAGMPDPDLVIRTAGEQRLSNFLIWQAAYAEFVFVKKTWPDFSNDDFDAALREFAARVRTFGGPSGEI
jgi:undecaprenyl diphosphate synthase